MDKMEYPRGLIRYTTENAEKGKHTRVLRPRIFIYALLLLALVSGTVWSMTHRMPLRADLIRDRNALFRELPDGKVENVYTLKITNMSSTAREFRLTTMPGSLAEIELSRPLHLGAEEVSGFPCASICPDPQARACKACNCNSVPRMIHPSARPGCAVHSAADSELTRCKP
jgi:polyferredoxin